jgi:hypothetical protein
MSVFSFVSAPPVGVAQNSTELGVGEMVALHVVPVETL